MQEEAAVAEVEDELDEVEVEVVDSEEVGVEEVDINARVFNCGSEDHLARNCDKPRPL